LCVSPQHLYFRVLSANHVPQGPVRGQGGQQRGKFRESGAAGLVNSTRVIRSRLGPGEEIVNNDVYYARL